MGGYIMEKDMFFIIRLFFYHFRRLTLEHHKFPDPCQNNLLTIYGLNQFNKTIETCSLKRHNQMTNVNVKSKIITLLEKILLGENLQDQGLGKAFLGLTSKNTVYKRKTW